MQHSLPECFLGTVWPVVAHVQHRLPCSPWALHGCLSHVSIAKAETVQRHCLSAEKACHISHGPACSTCMLTAEWGIVPTKANLFRQTVYIGFAANCHICLCCRPWMPQQQQQPLWSALLQSLHLPLRLQTAGRLPQRHPLLLLPPQEQRRPWLRLHSRCAASLDLASMLALHCLM